MDEGEVFRQDASVAHSSPLTSGLSDLESDASGDVEVRQASGDEDQRTDISSAASGIASDDGIKTKDGLSPLDAAAEAVIVESIPSFPDGNLDVHVADTKKCADWNFHADQSWRGHSVHDVEYEQHGPGKETKFLCRGVLLAPVRVELLQCSSHMCDSVATAQDFKDAAHPETSKIIAELLSNV
ncbi:hypothetical protein V8E36_000682 [Tilletia maclaganii]